MQASKQPQHYPKRSKHLPAFATPQTGFVSLWPYADFGGNVAAALYAAGCRKDKLPTKAHGYAVRMRVSAPGGVRWVARQLRSNWISNARIEGMYYAQGRPFELFKAVGRGRVTIWRRVESFFASEDPDDGITKEVSEVGDLIEKANPRNTTALAQFANKLAHTVTHDLAQVVKQPIKEYIEEMMGYFPGQRFEDLKPEQLNQLWQAGQTVLAPGLQAGYGLAAEQITQKLELSVLDIADKNRSFLKQNLMPTIANSFKTEDAEAIQQIGTQGGFWIRNSAGQISQSMDKQARNIIERGLSLGQGRDEIGQMLTDQLPGMWQKYGFNYARTVAANAVSRARSYSEAASYASVGIEYLELMAMLDERTTDICRVLDGTVISVKESLAHQKAIAAIQNPEDVQNVAPFMTQRKNKKTGDINIGIGKSKFATVARSGKGEVDDRGAFKRMMSTKKMVGKGVTMPPFHHQCRTMTVARVEMVQVPQGYEPKAGAMGATNDEKPPAGDKAKKQPQQRPLSFEKTPTTAKPTSSGQKMKYDPPIERKPGAKPKQKVKKPVGSRPGSMAERAAAAQNQVKTKYGESYKVTEAKTNTDSSTTVFKAEAGAGKPNILAMARMNSRGSMSRGFRPLTESQKPKSISIKKPAKHPVKNMGRSKENIASVDKRSKDLGPEWAKFTHDKELVARNSKKMLSGLKENPDFDAYIKKSGVSAEDFHYRVMQRWQRTSRDTDEMIHYMQLATKEEFGLPDNTMKGFKKSYLAKLARKKDHPEKLKAYRAYVRAQYDETQTILKEKGIKKVTLFRGSAFDSVSEAGFPDDIFPGGGLQNALLTTQPLSSYTMSHDVTTGFTTGGKLGMVVKQEVPAERVIGLPHTGFGNGGEHEFVCIGGYNDTADVLPWRDGAVDVWDLEWLEEELFE